MSPQVLAQRVKALDKAAFNRGSVLTLELERIVNTHGLAIGAARNEDALRGGVGKHTGGVCCRENIARADHGEIDRARNIVDDRPIGLAGIELLSRAAMHRHRRCARSLKAPRELRRGALPLAKRGAHLNGDRHARSGNAGAHDLFGELRRLHERTALALRDHLARRTRHVDVDERKARAHALRNRLDGASKLLGL